MILDNVLVSFFFMQLSDFLSTTCWKGCFISFVYSCLLHPRLINYNVYMYMCYHRNLIKTLVSKKKLHKNIYRMTSFLWQIINKPYSICFWLVVKWNFLYTCDFFPWECIHILYIHFIFRIDGMQTRMFLEVRISNRETEESETLKFRGSESW